MGTESASFLARLHKDAKFRRRFVKSPKAVLAEAGLDADALALPARIDEDELVKKLDRAFSDPTWATDFARAKPEKLSPKQLWERFGVIGWADAGGGSTSNASSVAAATVVYGVSMVTSSSSQVATVGKGALAMASVEQLKHLRELSRLPKGELSFAIVGPDGIGIDGINADMLAAFLARVK